MGILGVVAAVMLTTDGAIDMRAAAEEYRGECAFLYGDINSRQCACEIGFSGGALKPREFALAARLATLDPEDNAGFVAATRAFGMDSGFAVNAFMDRVDSLIPVLDAVCGVYGQEEAAKTMVSYHGPAPVTSYPALLSADPQSVAGVTRARSVLAAAVLTLRAQVRGH